MRLAGVLEG
jgi:hypothetical protein